MTRWRHSSRLGFSMRYAFQWPLRILSSVLASISDGYFVISLDRIMRLSACKNILLKIQKYFQLTEAAVCLERGEFLRKWKLSLNDKKTKKSCSGWRGFRARNYQKKDKMQATSRGENFLLLSCALRDFSFIFNAQDKTSATVLC